VNSHPNNVASRLVNLNTMARRVAAALAPFGFTCHPGPDQGSRAQVRHGATETTLVFGVSGVHLQFFTSPSPGTMPRVEFRSIRLGYQPHGAPADPADVDAIAFVAQVVAAECARHDAERNPAGR
jgi:hypothetical protein